MKVGSYRRIYKADYSEENQKDIDTLSITINDSFETLYGALNNQLTFSENINCTISTFNVALNKNDAPIAPITIKLSAFQKNVIGIIPIAITASNKTSLPNSGIFIDYTINNNTTSSSNITNQGNSGTNPLTININYIKGLPQNATFNIAVIII